MYLFKVKGTTCFLERESMGLYARYVSYIHKHIVVFLEEKLNYSEVNETMLNLIAFYE